MPMLERLDPCVWVWFLEGYEKLTLERVNFPGSVGVADVQITEIRLLSSCAHKEGGERIFPPWFLWVRDSIHPDGSL